MDAAIGTGVMVGLLGGWEITLILAIILILLGARHLPDFFRGMGKAIDEFKKAAHRVNEEASDTSQATKEKADDWRLWIAQGFDVGRIPFAPGTFGSAVGVLWFLILLVPGSLTLYLLGTILGLVISVWLCGEAEKILNQSDPGSVVLDEIVALPICFLPWVTRDWFRANEMPVAESFFTTQTWWRTVMIFGLFRLFDVWKPWPVRQSQDLPGGWGVTADDVLAALFVAALSMFLLP